MKVNKFKVLEMVLENGIRYGFRRAYKHTENPSDEYVYQCIFDAITTEFFEWFNFDENEMT